MILTKRTGLDSLIGLTTEKQRAFIDIKACRMTGEVMNHILLFGPGGCGKTSYARAIAEELDYHFVEREGASLKTRTQIIELLITSDAEAANNNKPLMLFVDEVHRLPIAQQEVFYYPMKEWRVTTADSIIEFNPFTLICATTRRDMLDENSFVSRFQNKWEIRPYDNLHIQEILASIFEKEKLEYDPQVIESIANRCLGIPRQASNLAMKIRNEVLASGSRRVTLQDIYKIFELEELDDIGLSSLHVRYLCELLKANGAPKGLRALSGKLSQNEDVIVGSVEPILLSLDFIDLQPRGRVLTQSGHCHLANNGFC